MVHCKLLSQHLHLGTVGHSEVTQSGEMQLSAT
jgi:hypothetical protein